MKKYFLPLILFALFATVSCIEEENTDEADDPEVKTETVYKLKKYKQDVAEIGVTEVSFTYNENDQVASVTRKLTTDSGESTTITEFTYDSEGRVIEAKIDGVTDYEYMYGAGKITYKGYYMGEPSYEYEWTLNSDGKVIKSVNVNYGSYDEYQWDGENLAKMTLYNNEGELSSEYEYTYDEEVLTPAYGIYCDVHPAKQTMNAVKEQNWIYEGEDDVTVYSLLSNDDGYLTKKTFDTGYFGTSTTTYTYETVELEVE